MFRARAISLAGSFLLFFGAVTAAAQERRVVRPQYGSFGMEVLVGGGPLDVIYGRGRRYVEARAPVNNVQRPAAGQHLQTERAVLWPHHAPLLRRGCHRPEKQQERTD